MKEEIMEAAKGLTRHEMAVIAEQCSSGAIWRGCSKGHMAEASENCGRGKGDRTTLLPEPFIAALKAAPRKDHEAERERRRAAAAEAQRKEAKDDQHRAGLMKRFAAAGFSCREDIYSANVVRLSCQTLEAILRVLAAENPGEMWAWVEAHRREANRKPGQKSVTEVLQELDAAGYTDDD